ncbi:hypothetical protein [Winogradskyella pulchriflava]|uniref:DUF4131 domain-containing protein n=1 Tax=Winogradskyella pulchriflava TaxID=1110688 RepID=A0ABV6QDT6_9FLAO
MIIQEQNFWFGLLALFFCLIILDFNKDYWNLSWIRISFKVLAFLCLIFTFWNKFSGMNKKEPLEGVLNGTLNITDELIEIDNQIYEINRISNLQIKVKNYSGELQGKPNHPGPWRSNGAGNNISFISNGIKIKKDFFIQSEKDFETLKKIKEKINTVANTVYN